MKSSRSWPSIVVYLAISSQPLLAHAQTAPRTGTERGPTRKPGQLQAGNQPAPTQEQFQEAQRRYEEAIKLFNDGSYEAALLEFRRAYELAPTYKILYNVALVNVQINDYAEALAYFQRYLAEGGSEVPVERVEEVKRRIAELTPRVATVSITTNVASGQLVIDDLVVAELPLGEPLRVNAGRRKITVNAKGKLPATKVVELAGGDAITVTFDLRDPNAPATPPVRDRTTSGPSSSFPWAAWIGTGALAVGAGVTGYLALRANSDLKDKKDTFGVSESELEDAREKQRRFAIAADVLAASAVVLGGVALYLTLSDSSATDEKPAQAIRVGVGPRAVWLNGSF